MLLPYLIIPSTTNSETDDDVELHLRDMSMANNTAAAITFKINAKGGGANTRGSFLALPGEEDLSSFSGERRELWLRNRLSWLRAGVYKLLISKPSLLEKAGAAMVMRMSGDTNACRTSCYRLTHCCPNLTKYSS